MIELLVTIIIAAIAFAALVPVFVSANAKNSSEILRNMSLQLARDKIEKLRLVPYDQITFDNLRSATFASDQFGTSATVHSGTGDRNLTLSYTVTDYPTGYAAGQQTYKQVTVTVTWDAPPKPVLPAVLSTVVYKQYAGPQIIDFGIGPDSILEVYPAGSETHRITGSPVVVDAYLDPADVGSMTPTSGTTKGYVRFTVTNLNGTYSLQHDVEDSDSGAPAHYQWTWGNYAVPDGIYIFSATAYSASGQQGNVVSYGMNVQVTTPPAPTNLAGVVQNNSIALTWDATPIGNFKYYQVWRSTDGVTFSYLAGNGSGAPPSLSVSNYTDSTAVNGSQYWYEVRVWNTLGNPSPWSAVAGPLVPAVQTDIVAPSVPAGLTVNTVIAQNALSVSWSASTDGGTPATGVRGYDVQRSPDNSTWQQILSAAAFNQLTYTDTGLSWNTPYHYRVRAVDWAGNAGAWTSPVQKTTVAQPKWTLTVTNTNGSSDITVWVQSTTTSLWWVSGHGNQAASSQSPKPAGNAINKSKSDTWLQLPQDNYNVSTSGSTSTNISLTADAAISFNQ